MSEKDSKSLARACLDAFSSESNDQGRRLRELLDRDPQAFEDVAFAMMQEATDTPVVRYTLALLSARGKLAPVVRRLASRDPGSAAALTHLGEKVDARMGGSLHRSPDPPGSDSMTQESKEALLCALGETMRGGLSLMSTLMDGGKPSPKAKSRIARTLGRAISLYGDFEDLLSDTDARVRANAVEALWNARGELPRRLLLQASTDEHHRVAANALVGLYLMGDVEALTRLRAMSEHPDPLFRAAAVWAMGRTGDERFEPMMRKMRTEGRSSSTLLRAMLPALARIRHRAEADSGERVEIAVLGSSLDGPDTCWTLALATSSPAVHNSVRAVHFQPATAQGPVWEYTAVEQRESAPVEVCLLLPLAIASGGVTSCDGAEIAAAAVAAHRPAEEFRADRWMVSGYREYQPAHFAAAPLDAMRLAEFEEDAPIVHFDTPKTAGEDEPLAEAASSLEARRAPLNLAIAGQICLSSMKTTGRAGSILAVVDQMKPEWAAEGEFRLLAQRLRARSVRFHSVVTSRADSRVASSLAGLAAATDGYLLRCEADDAGHAVATLVSALTRRWKLSLAANLAAGPIELRLLSGTAHGHTILRRPVPQSLPQSAA